MSQKKSFFRSPYFWAAVISMITLPLLRPFLRYEPKPPPVLFTLPDFTLVDNNGANFGTSEMRGKVWVADFIFTRCTTVCPLLTKGMAELQQKFVAAKVPIHLLSISVDPEHDLPPVLTEYAKKFGADFSSWVLLTGQYESVTRVVESFQLAMESNKPVENIADIAHAQKFVIVDKNLGVRGFYNSDAMGIDEVFNRAQHVYFEKTND